MEFIDSYCAIIGIIAIGIGVYELFTKKLVGRKDVKASKEQIRKFLPFDAATYMIDGVLLTIMGLPQYFPFMAKGTAIIATITVSIALVAANVYFARKYL